MTRIKVWFDPFSDFRGKGWQGSQSLLSIASGGIWGLGLGQGRQKQLYLPEPANDFIFSVACEELGFIGAFIAGNGRFTALFQLRRHVFDDAFGRNGHSFKRIKKEKAGKERKVRLLI